MTATPIPRTVAMTVFGDLETSVLDQLPAGRSPISSHVVPARDKPHFLARAWDRVRERSRAATRQYVVCPRIGDDEDDTASRSSSPPRTPSRQAAAAGRHRRRRAARPRALAGLRVEVLHGRMHPDDKDAVMRRFAAGDTDVLVATTVIEVGVNVPNATAMVIMDADRFGVSQLHQLRGRVGRGSAPGLCLLVTDMPEASPARQRLNAVASTLDGFELSRIDLEQRREGGVLEPGPVRRPLLPAHARRHRRRGGHRRRPRRSRRARPRRPRPGAAPALRTALDALLDTEREEYLDKG